MAGILDQLSEHIYRGVTTPFRWGVIDCSMWVSDWVLAITGKDPAAGYRGRFVDKPIACMRVDRNNGGVLRIFDDFAKANSMPEIHAQDAVPGDVAAICINVSRNPARLIFWHALAIRGKTAWLAKINDGLWRLDHDCVVTAWRIK